MRTAYILLFSFFYVNLGFSQSSQLSSGEILLKLNKLNVLGNALYVAAHPDDENTRMIAYLGNHRLVNTAYLSLTRGDGGQNLIGPELREGLGVIRTQELLAARRIDGGRQFFSRANDFGYSKTAEETLEIWNAQEVLGDAVWVYRNFRPDVIITRFPPDSRAGHGHHTSSAIIAEKAFNVAGTDAYSEQFDYVTPWQPTRIMINSGRWWDSAIEEKEGVLKVDVGAYSPFLGFSYTEIAADSRSQHKSQGFGNTRSRGSSVEYLTLTSGEEAEADLFDGIDITWNRVGAKEIATQVNTIIEDFNPADAAASVPALLNLRGDVAKIKDEFWRDIKLKEVDQLIIDCAGVYLGGWAENYTVVPGESLSVNLEIVNRSAVAITLKSLTQQGVSTTYDSILANNIKSEIPVTIDVAKDAKYTSPYWLQDPAALGMYTVKEQLMRGKPENDPAFTIGVALEIDNQLITYEVPVVYRWTDRVNGGKVRPVVIVPAVTLTPNNSVIVFNDKTSRPIEVSVTAGKDSVSGTATLDLPTGWSSEPVEHQVTLAQAGEVANIRFLVTPGVDEQLVDLGLHFKIKDEDYDLSEQTIAYNHIPYQVLLPMASVKAVRANINSAAKTVGYIMGAGDAVPASLEQLGINVWVMNEFDITEDNLKNLDAVILGVRALNTESWLKNKKDILLDYVNNGGTMVTQYNTTRRLDWHNFSPYELKFTGRSGDSRVSQEDAPIRILAPENPVMTTPNRLTEADFTGWVQERGLYFPSEWSEEFTAVLSANDPGEQPLNGGLLVSKYGKGHYVYTGYSFFRELPAGVPGAMKLFTNIISLSQVVQQKEITTGEN